MRSVTALVLGLCLLFASPPARGQSLSNLGAVPAEAREETQTPVFDGEYTIGPAQPQVAEVAGFDPARDVPAMQNWVPVTSTEGPAHCFGISLLTTYFQRRIRFREGAEGEALEKSWRWRHLPTTEVAPDPAGIQLVFEFLGTKNDRDPLTVAGSPGLYAFTSEEGPGREHFRRIAEAVQFCLQLPNQYPEYLLRDLISKIDLIRDESLTREGLNKKAFETIRGRVAEGEVAPLTMHSSEDAMSGHVVVAYRVEAFGSEGKITCYDSNYPPQDGVARPTVLTFDLTAGNFTVANHEGKQIWSKYDLVTPVQPERLLLRSWMRNIARNLPDFLWATDHLYSAFEALSGSENSSGERWTDWQETFLEDWEAGKESFQDRSHWTLRWKLREVR